MRGYIANTDFDWYQFLRERSPFEEVNFWLPSGRNMLRIEPGAPFFFKLKKPHYADAGFGLVARAEVLPAWLAWDSFGIANGAPDFPTMRQRIERYRSKKDREIIAGDYAIGCVMVSAPVFFEPGAWVFQPADWQPNNVRGEYYDLGSGEGARIFRESLARMPGEGITPRDLLREPARRYGEPVLVKPRLGQGTFRIAVTDAYSRACSVTGEHSLPVLEAAHIQPYSQEGPHEVSNGLLLRSDLHRLFDRGYVTVTTDFKLEVSGRLKKDFSNGKSYYPFHGQTIRLPLDASLGPARRYLAYHNENRFLV